MSKIPGIPDKQTDTITGVERALFVIEQLAEAPDGLSFTEILNILEVNKSIAFKLLNTLIATRYVFKDEKTGNYCLTYRISNVGMKKMSRSRLLNQSQVILRELADQTGEFIRLAVVEQDTITWVMSILTKKRYLQIDPNYSTEIGLHTHAAGKAWLATIEPDRARRLILERGIQRMTPHSLVDIKKIMADLHVTAERGYAISYEEHGLGVGAIGAPIMVQQFGSEQPRCVGVVTLAAPVAHMDRAALETCAPQVVATAEKLASVWPYAHTEVFHEAV
ncbi:MULTISPECIES: IclR family transcriptional regulator [Ramlibacter]|uniref:Helix-turn-helix domain-containing protein n=1 Tax=Ramlibacter pinisoli TaxID=2682844 RepID=A0A6N8IZW6_9BURK|nr:MULTISPECIES: IclR family transcriptional regulator [Ramlibacter]MBA2962170.1 IclR family transcriptional regulator [Ramlibacter sp. CGMCC 1.13660]MVQ32112.1 helix-turn-helix domain-containing protein [Ramlibacter pinisoli]